MPAFALYLLGPPRLEKDGDEIHVSRRKAMALLAYLAMERCRHRRDSLATLLWPLYNQGDARGQLRRHLHVLRQLLGPDALVANRETAALNADWSLSLDVDAFLDGLSACGSHTDAEACETCIPRLEQAVALYRDGFLAGFSLEDSAPFDEWQTFQAQVIRDEVTAALARLTHWYEEAGDTAKRMAHARKWLSLDSVHEPAHRALMRLYTQTGQDAAALRQYRQCVRVLEAELGLAPSVETTALYNAIRAQRAQAPEPVVAMASAPERPAFLDDQTAQAAPASPRFVGREPELARLDGYLDEALDGQGKVTFIIGGPGRGKSSLMRAFAQRAMASHPDLLVLRGTCNALAGVGDPYLPFREVLASLTGDLSSLWTAGAISRDHARRLWHATPIALKALVDEGPHLLDILVPAKSVASRLDQLRSSGAPWEAELRKLCAGPTVTGLRQLAVFQQATAVLSRVAVEHPILVLLDDLQWMDAGSIGLLFHLSRRLAGHRVLVLGAYRPEEVAVPTAHPVGAGEAVHTLGQLLHELKRDHGDVWIDLRESDQATGRAFVDVLIDSEPNQLDQAFRDALCARTGGHPLFTVELLRTMQDRGDLQQDVAGTWVATDRVAWDRLPARVEAVVAARLGRLTQEQRDLLTVASVEGENFTAEVVAQVEGLGPKSVLRTLGRELSSRHRLVRDSRAIKADGRRLSQFRFSHALFQEFLYQDLTEGERSLLHGEVAAALEELHRTHLGEVAAQLAHHFDRAGDSAKAIEYAARAGERARLAYANGEAIRHYERCLEIAGDTPSNQDQRWQLLALSGLGKILYNTGRLPEAETRLQEAIAVAKRLAVDPQEMAKLYFWLGEVLWWRAKYEERFRLAQEGRGLVSNAPRSLGAALMNQTVFGTLHNELAMKLTEETADFILDLPYTEELRPAFDHILIVVHLDRKDISGALHWTRELEKRAMSHNDLDALVLAHRQRSNLNRSAGNLRRAADEERLALDLARQIGDTKYASWSLGNLASLHLGLDEIQTAAQYHDEAHHLKLRIGFRRDIADHYEQRGSIAYREGDLSRALSAYKHAEGTYRSIGLVENALWDRHSQGRIQLSAGGTEEALASFRDAIDGHIAWEGSYGIRSLATMLAGVEEAHSDPAEHRRRCDAFRAAHPKTVWAVSQWYLTPADVRLASNQCTFNIDFGLVDPGWRWLDPFEDCRYLLREGLEIQAARGRDLWDLNLSAPRLMRDLPTSAGQGIVQTVCAPADAPRPAVGGLLLWCDRQNYLWLRLGDASERDVALGGCIADDDVIVGRGNLPGVPSAASGSATSPLRVGLRFELAEGRVYGFCTPDPDGGQWYSVGNCDFPTDRPLQVGVHAIGMEDRIIYPGPYPDGTAIRFESFTIWEG